MQRLRLTAILIGLLCFAARAALGQCQYEVTAIIEGPECFFGPAAVSPAAMNDHGTVVGWWQDCFESDEHPFVWTQQDGLVEVELDLPVANVVSARVTDINNDGDVCGWFVAQDGEEYFGSSFVLTGAGDYFEIPIPAGGFRVEAHAINEAGAVFGWWVAIESGRSAFRWKDGKMSCLEGTEGFDSTSPRAVSATGQFTGDVRINQGDEELAFLWDDGAMTILPPVPPNGIDSSGRAVNAHGSISGGGVVIEEEMPVARGFKWSDESVMENIGVLPGFLRSGASGIADNGFIVGECWSVPNAPAISTSAIWHDGVVFDLADFVDLPPNTFVRGAVDINGAGQILSKASTTSSTALAMVLTPVAVPRADITGDCSVDRRDLITLIENWSATDSFADITGDGVVNVFDLLRLLAGWGS